MMVVAAELWLLLCAFGTTLITLSYPHVLQFMLALLTDSTVCILKNGTDQRVLILIDISNACYLRLENE